MDVEKILNEMYEDRDKLQRIIDSLEELASTHRQVQQQRVEKRPGRKSMNAAERQEVSARMKRYWQGRKRVAGKL